MPITEEEANEMRPTEAHVKRIVVESLRGKSEWYTANELAELNGMEYTDDIYIPSEQRSLAELVLVTMMHGRGVERKADFQMVLDKMELEDTIRCVVSRDNVRYYHSA